MARALLAVCASIASATILAGDLTIEVSGVTPGHGKVYLAIYDRQETFPIPGRQIASQVVDPTDRHLTVRFKDLPPGQYAAAAFQDFNGNGKLDKNFLGIPREPYGFSNGARAIAGPPKFSQAAVTLAPDGVTHIEVK